MLKKIRGMFEYSLSCEQDNFEVGMTLSKKESGLEEICIELDSGAPCVPAPMRLEFYAPIVDVQGCWRPGLGVGCPLPVDWMHPMEAKATSSAPVVELFGKNYENRLCFACSDALNIVKYSAGVHEESAEMQVYALLFDAPMAPISHYQVRFIVDTRPQFYAKTLNNVAAWWRVSGYEAAEVPECARLPMYSSWYSFHQRLNPAELERQCALSAQLGCKTVIVDDGWQTDDNARGYAYCGDWAVCQAKMGDMRAHVERVHDLGMKYMLWYSVPYVGVKSTAWAQFKDRMLEVDEEQGAGILDPRYPEVREYLISTYERAMREWNLDGFKLDFVDAFRQPERENPNAPDGRDTPSVPVAVDRLLKETLKRLRAIKPDVLIEFRQRYTGPAMRGYGNMFRAADCPNDRVLNRVRTLDIRLLCEDSAAHADMLMWNREEPVESAALQMINVLFAVPQISVLLDKLPEAHRKMAAFYLNFWRENRDVLLDGELKPFAPELAYPLVKAENENKLLAVAYADCCLEFQAGERRQILLVNASGRPRLVADCAADLGERTYRVLNCMGEETESGTIALKAGVQALKVPESGVMIIE